MRIGPTNATAAALVLVLMARATPLLGQEGDVYRAVTVQAAPGELLNLIDLLKEEQALARAGGEAPAMMFRHSQGDFWDIFLLYPVTDLAAHLPRRVEASRLAPGAGSPESPGPAAELQAAIDGSTTWREEVFVHGPPVEQVTALWAQTGFFHLEMFQGLAGKRDELIAQRRMENDYLERIGKEANAIFTRIAGASTDAFTIGFYRDLAHYAEPNAVSDEAAGQAAIDAGFEGRAYIGSYLRSLILRHHDTLGVAIP